VPSVNEALWSRTLRSTWTANTPKAGLVHDPKYGAEMVRALWNEGSDTATIEVTSLFATRDRAVDLASRADAPALSDAERRLYTAPTELIPTGGLVKETADKITAGRRGEVEKARALYEWIVENTFRDPKVRGCGIGDITGMLKTGNLSGKCADLNALLVGLARASGLPARDVYGLRVAPSKFGYKSLGAGSQNVTKAQHCRAEVFLTGIGWAPIDPADVRKVVLEEPPGNLALDDAKVTAARRALFGAWEGNWVAYNVAHDLALPGARGPKLAFLMYPQAEVGGTRLDCLEPDTFAYTITATELPA
jgi:transglutaminase-like putative cysteine protease